MIRIHLLGAVDVRDAEGQPIAGPPLQPKRAAILAYLAAAQPRGMHRRDTLMALFWPELDETRARRALNQSLHHLRSALGDDVVASEGRDQIGIDPSHAWTDVAAFEEALERGDLEGAIGVYRGNLLEGFHVSELPELERWVESARERLRRRAEQALSALADAAARAGDHAEAATLARKAFTLAPSFDEPAFRKLVVALDRVGDRAGALREHELFAAGLATELDAAPSPETVELIERIRGRMRAHSAPGRNERVTPAPFPPAVVNTPAAPPPASSASISTPTSKAPASNSVTVLRIAALLVLLAGAGLAAKRSWEWLRPAPVRTGGVAVFPFTYSGPAAATHTADGVAGLIASNLSGFRSLHSIDQRAVAMAAESESPLTQRRAAQIALDLGARMFMLGSVAEAGGRLRITATLYDGAAFGDAGEATVEGNPDDLFALADKLTALLLAKRLDADEGAGISSAGRTTGSAEALEAFTSGEVAFRSGKFSSALEEFRRAVEIDTTFATAYLRLSNAANWTGDNALASTAAARAMAFGTRLGGRDRLRVTGWDAYLRGSIIESERIYRSMLAEDSSDIDAWRQLGEIAFHYGAARGHSAAQSRDDWERTLSLSRYDIVALLHLARVSAREGRVAEFTDLASRAEDLNPGAEAAAELQLLKSIVVGDTRLRQDVIARTAALREPVRKDVLRHGAYASTSLDGFVADARRAMFGSVFFDNREAGEMAVFAGMELAGGRMASARALLDSAALVELPRILEYRAAVAVAPLGSSAVDVGALRRELAGPPKGRGADYPVTRVWRLYARGMLALRSGDDGEAGRIAQELEQIPASTDLRLRADDGRWHARLIEAERMRRAGRSAQALELLGTPDETRVGQPGIWQVARAHERFLRGELLADIGRPAEALAWFETFPDPSGYDYLYLLPAELWQLRLHTSLGHRGPAADHRRRIAELTAHADAAFRRSPDDLLALLDSARGNAGVFGR